MPRPSGKATISLKGTSRICPTFIFVSWYRSIPEIAAQRHERSCDYQMEYAARVTSGAVSKLVF